MANTSGIEISVTAPDAKKTLGELRNEIKELKKSLNSLVPESQAFAKQAEIISQKQTNVNNAMKMAWSESAKMKDAYFRTGLEVRQLILSSNALSPALKSVATNFDMGVMNALQLRNALRLMGFQMGALGVAAVAAIPMIVDFFQKQAEEAKKAREEFTKLNKEWHDFLLQSNQISGKEKQGLLGTDIETIKAQAAAARKEIDLLQFRIDLRKKANIEGEKPGTLRLQEELNKKMEEYDRFNLRIAQTEERRLQIANEMAGRGEFSPVLNTSPVSQPRMTLGGSRSQLFGGARRGLGSFTTPIVITPELQQANQLVSGLTQTLASGATRFSQTLLSALIEGRNIAQSIGYALLGIGLDVVTGGIGNLITGKTFFGDKTGFGGGSDMVSLSASRANGGMNSSMIKVVPLISSSGLAVQVEVGNRINKGRRI